MKVRDKFAAEPRTFSFEFSPPRTPDAVARLFETAERLRSLAPTFVSVTYGAGGSTRRNTIDVVTRLQHELGDDHCRPGSLDRTQRVLGRAGHGHVVVLGQRRQVARRCGLRVYEQQV